jgi:hypothetical protein
MTEEANVPKPLDLGILTKMVAVLSALSYGTGIVAINTYLHGLGIADFSFAKPKLLLTGTLILSSFLVLAAAPIFIAWRMAGGPEKALDKEKATSVSRGVLYVGIASLLLLAFAAYLLCFRLTTDLGQIREWWISDQVGMQDTSGKIRGCIVVVVLIYAPVWAAALSAYKAKRLFRRANAPADLSHAYLARFYCALSIAVMLVSIIAYVAAFTFIFYPSIPVEFGGGKPYFESFAIADGQQCQLRQIGVPFVDDVLGITKPLPVLHESDTIVAVWVHRKGNVTETTEENQGNKGLGIHDDVVVQIDKSAIQAIRAYPHARAVPQLNRSQGPCGGSAKPADPAPAATSAPAPGAASTPAPMPTSVPTPVPTSRPMRARR